MREWVGAPKHTPKYSASNRKRAKGEGGEGEGEGGWVGGGGDRQGSGERF